MNKVYLLLLLLSLSSCFVQLDYLGNSYSPTKNVDVFVDATAIKKSYVVMGKTYFEMRGLISLEKVQEKAIEKAKQKGADAVLFRDYFIQEGGAIQTVTKSDSIGSSSLRVRTTTSTPVETTRLDILFLKYD